MAAGFIDRTGTNGFADSYLDPLVLETGKTYEVTSLKGADYDWIAFETLEGHTYTIQLEAVYSSGSGDLQIRNPNVASVPDGSTGPGLSEITSLTGSFEFFTLGGLVVDVWSHQDWADYLGVPADLLPYDPSEYGGTFRTWIQYAAPYSGSPEVTYKITVLDGDAPSGPTDDYDDGPSTTGIIDMAGPGSGVTAATTINGSLEEAGDKDSFKVSLQNGFRYDIHVVSKDPVTLRDFHLDVDRIGSAAGIGTGEPYSEDYAASAALGASYAATMGVDLAALSEPLGPMTGGTTDVLVTVSGQSGDTGDYEIIITTADDHADGPNTTSSIAPGGSVSGLLEEIPDYTEVEWQGEIDYFRIAGGVTPGYTYLAEIDNDTSGIGGWLDIELHATGAKAFNVASNYVLWSPGPAYVAGSDAWLSVTDKVFHRSLPYTLTLTEIKNSDGLGDGDDTAKGTSAADYINGNGGNDRISGGSGGDVLIGGEGRDKISGNGGGDVASGGSGKDKLSGGKGGDTLSGDGGNDKVDGGAGGDKLSGGGGKDTIKGGAGKDTIDGGAGRDKIDGGKGADDIDGGAGPDRINGGAGDDTIEGGAGNDRLTGGAGSDVFLIGPGHGHDVIWDFSFDDPDEAVVFSGLPGLDGRYSGSDLLDIGTVTADGLLIDTDGGTAGDSSILLKGDFPSPIDAIARFIAPRTVDSIHGEPIDTTRDWLFGSHVSFVGDVNKDGFDDFVIQGSSFTTYSQSAAHLFLGRADGWSGATFIPTDGSSADADHIPLIGLSPRSMSGPNAAGDVNGDGFDDVLAFGWSGKYVSDGARLTLTYGSDDLGTSFDDTTMVGARGDTLSTSLPALYGFDAIGIGDFNGDGLDDYAFEPNTYQGADFPSSTLARQVSVVFGSTSGLPSVADLGALDGVDGFTFVTTQAGNRTAPLNISPAGDVNHDGLDDFLVSTIHDGGAVYVIFGNTDITRPATLLNTDLDGAVGVGLESSTDTYSQYFGGALSEVGDVDGDGIDDFLVGRPTDPGVSGYYTYGAGTAMLIYGREDWTGRTGGPFRTSEFTFSSDSSAGVFDPNLGFAVAGAGDVNGDGLADFIISGWDEKRGVHTPHGAVYLVFGQAGGLDASIDLRDGYADIGYRIEAPGNTSSLGGTPMIAGGSSLGWSVDGGGDINGDGFDDILLGAPSRFGADGQRPEVIAIHGGLNTFELLDAADGSRDGNIVLSQIDLPTVDDALLV